MRKRSEKPNSHNQSPQIKNNNFHFSDTDKIGILGRSGTGKSYLAQKILEIYPRKIIFDSLYEYSNFGDIFHNFNDFSENIIKNKNSNNFSTIIQFDIESANNSDEFEEMLRISYYRGNCCVFIDEIQNFSTVHYLSYWLRQMILTGRHRKICFIYTTQRPGELHKTILSQTSKIFCGNLHSNNDIKTMANYLGKNDEEISNLEDRKFIYWTPGKQSVIINNDLSSIKNDENINEPEENQDD